MDVTNAFLHGDLYENIYMKLPTGYTYEGCRIQVIVDDSSVSKPPPNLVCNLNISLYGLRQSPRLWFAKFATTLINQGYL